MTEDLDPDNIPWVDAGHGVQFVFFDSEVDQPAGLLERHGCPSLKDSEEVKGGSILFNTPYNRGHYPGFPLWDVDSFNPISLRQNVGCTLCGFNGLLREGIWYPMPNIYTGAEHG